MIRNHKQNRRNYQFRSDILHKIATNLLFTPIKLWVFLNLTRLDPPIYRNIFFGFSKNIGNYAFFNGPTWVDIRYRICS